MTTSSRLMIDIFPHIYPKKYSRAILEESSADRYWQNFIRSKPPSVFEIEHRLKMMDSFEGYVQVLNVSTPPIEAVVGPKKALKLAQIANDEMAELVSKYPDRFIAAVAHLPMNNMDAAMKELDRAINDLGFKGVQIHTPIDDKSLDSAEFMPLYEKMSQYDLPILVHPHRPDASAEYKTEDRTKYRINVTLGRPYETSTFMARLVFSGIMEKFPNLKIVTHHCGGLIPFFESRLRNEPISSEMRGKEEHKKLTRMPIEYFRMFYADNANVRLPALRCSYEFFGADRIVFGTDMPNGPQLGEFFIKLSIDTIEQLNVTNEEKVKIFEGNSRKLLRLTP